MKRVLIGIARLLLVLAICSLAIAGIVVVASGARTLFASKAERLLREADRKAWLNNWGAATPLYQQAEVLFRNQGERSKALYASVSQVPAASETGSLPEEIGRLDQDLLLPEARDTATRLRILEVKGYLEVDYDASEARKTYQEVQALALRRGRFLLASRAIGEQGIAAYLVGDTATARNQTLTAWTVAKVFRDEEAHIRYASLYAAGLVALGRYKESLGPVDEAFRVWRKTPEAAYPSIAAAAKVQALTGLGRSEEALDLVNDQVRRAEAAHRGGRLYDAILSRGNIQASLDRWPAAINDYLEANRIASLLSYWRGLTETGGPLARAYEHQDQLALALGAIDKAIGANTHIPDELYYVPGNLAIKAEILARMGHLEESNLLYEKSALVIDSLLAKSPTQNVERLLLTTLGNVYSGYFISLISQHRESEALAIIEREHGRLEVQALQHRGQANTASPSPAERRLGELNVKLIQSDDVQVRHDLESSIYEAEQELPSSALAGAAITTPVSLAALQKDVSPSELFLEYVLATPHSYVLAVTSNSARAYELPDRKQLEREASEYRRSVTKPGVHASEAGAALYRDLLGSIPEFGIKSNVLLVPDGDLQLLPFAALPAGSSFVVATHTISVVPSGTVLDLLRRRGKQPRQQGFLPYVGVAAWTESLNLHHAVARGMQGLSLKELGPLPESKAEVVAIASDLPQPSTVLLGSSATETQFKRLPLERYSVLHLALHGYADDEYPDRSALAFAPETSGPDDGLLQLREIRHLHLRADLVTLSACDTGVGPVDVSGVSNLGNAFLEAGSQTVVSALWQIDDRATKTLMLAFYKNLAGGEGKAKALHDAQLELWKDGLSPYYWAGFQITGEPAGVLSR